MTTTKVKPRMRKHRFTFPNSRDWIDTADYVRAFGKLNNHVPAWYELGGKLVLL